MKRRREIKDPESEKKRIAKRKRIVPTILFVLVVGMIFLYTSQNWVNSVVAIVVSFLLIQAFFFTAAKLEDSTKIRKMEDAFPDFLQLMASNLRAGMTVDRALLLSSRKEFDPLDKEILNLGKDILTGQEMEYALIAMGKRIKSEKISKTINLIISGIRSGGNLAVLLEETSANMRERNFVEKKAASNVLMYIIFIFFAMAIGAPTLFALSNVLVEVLGGILSSIPNLDAGSSGMPFTFSAINISPAFILYFSLVFMIALDVLGSLILGIVGKGEEKAGLKYVVPLVVVSLTVFFVIKTILSGYLSEFF